jgi:hypothetical protein
MTDDASYLEEVVSANNLDGFKDVFWNLGQIVAWVWTGSPFPVDALSNSTEDMARRDRSMPPSLPHYAAEYADMCADENGLARITSPFQSIDDVFRALLRSFQSGAMTASGQRSISSRREPIPAMEWAGLTIADSIVGEMIIRQREGHDAAWHDVRVQRDEVLRAFPTGPMADVEAKERNKGGRPPDYDWEAVKEYALGLVKQHGVPGRSNRRLPSKSQLVEAIVEEWAKKDIQLADATVRRYVGGWLKDR